MSEPESTRSGERSRAAVAGWDGVRPTDVKPLYLTGNCPERAELAAGLRAVADLLERRPELPIPSVTNRGLQVYASGTNDEMRAQVEYAGRLLGVPVKGDLPKDRICKVEKSFGRFSYGFSAVRTDEEEPAAFAVGQEVRLAAEPAKVAAAANVAQAGYVVAREANHGGKYSYTVHFPGRTGTDRGWSASALEAAPPFPRIRTANGEVTSMEVAETLLIDLTVQIRLGKLYRQPADEAVLADHFVITAELSRACGMSGGELLRQIMPEVREHIRAHLRERHSAGKTAARVAAGDVPQPAARAAAAAGQARTVTSGASAVPQPRHGSSRKA